MHDALIRTLGSSLPAHEFYFAGPPATTQALQAPLMSVRLVPFEHIHFDRFF